MVIYLFKGSISHWQESRSRNISRRNDSIFPRSLEKIEFSLLFLFSIFKIFRKEFYFSSRFMIFLNPFSFFLRKNSLSLLDDEIQKHRSCYFVFWERFLCRGRPAQPCPLPYLEAPPQQTKKQEWNTHGVATGTREIQCVHKSWPRCWCWK